MTLRIASTFLSHKSEDRKLVREVAEHLGWRGVRPWLDTQELPAGVDLPSRLRAAVEAQNALVIFLSRGAIGSSWVRDELNTALALESEGRKDRIIPVFLGDPEELVRSHPELRKRWMNPEQTRVDRLGISAVDREPAEVASEIAKAIYAVEGTRESHEVAVLFDQRDASVVPVLPPSLANLDCPALLFWPDRSDRSLSAVVDPARWDHVAKAVRWSLEHALNLNRYQVQRVHWRGTCQMALAALFGWVVQRSSANTLVLYDPSGSDAELQLRPFLQPLKGNPSPAVAGTSVKGMAVMIAPRDHDGCSDARKDAIDRSLALAEVRSPCSVSDATDILNVAANVTSTVAALKSQYGFTRLYLYNLSAAHLLAGVVSMLQHVVTELTVVEWRRDINSYELYPMV